MSGKRVLWYMCGPTVYDSSHMGHARTYMSFDILRRIMETFFGYDVVLCMNITDVEDKIIMRANERKVDFRELTRQYEKEFFDDMTNLGVAGPTVLTRVSEYVPEIVAYISRIIGHGFGYASNGSVYFDTAAYMASKSHIYGKLVPENVGNTAALAEGEGTLPAASLGAGDKRDPNDFVLWKCSRPGEPSWPSMWGPGRPGWHIECSAMCGEVLGLMQGGPIDIHSGGVDLRFPHHENEIAQSEAYYDSPQWVNYFIHSGHLHIEGLKMSKSLKNFIKISDALEVFGARQLRLLFLLQRYNSPMNYSERAMEHIAGVEKGFLDFFANVKAKLRTLQADLPQHWGSPDHAFHRVLSTIKDTVARSLADDFDTPSAMAALQELVGEVNRYMAQPAAAAGSAGRPPVLFLLQTAAQYVSYIFRVFGLIDPHMGIGFSLSGGADASGAGFEETVAPFLDRMAGFRERVRKAARAGDTGAVLRLCDELRDVALPPLGVLLEDEGATTGGGGDSASAAWVGKWKLRDPAELQKELDEKRRAVDEKARAKAIAVAEAAARLAEKEAKSRIDPKAMFLSQTDKFSVFDADGVPTHDAAGVEVPKPTRKKLAKEQTLQAKLHQWWLARESGAAGSGAPDGPDDGDAAV